MTPDVSIIISTHKPDRGRLARTLAGLAAQALPATQWELVLVDNASDAALTMADVASSSRAETRLIREDRLGLTFGRLAGIGASRGEILVFVDDDNVLATDYLQNALSIFRRLPRLGLGGGKSVPEWEAGAPPAWVSESYDRLALRDRGAGEEIAALTDPPAYPDCAPIGAGMIARRAALAGWVDACAADGAPSGRRGRELTSGEDCDIVMFALRAGWQVGYFPELMLTHLIPAARVTRDYLARLSHGISKSWVQVLARHGIFPWRPISRGTVPLRAARAYLRERAWTGPGEYVRWRAACGQFAGQAIIGCPTERQSANLNHRTAQDAEC
jgi:glycosyltransferase involved in cell wall biosynthesis